MAYVYILYSPSLNLYYIGYTIDLSNRIIEHNLGKHKDAFTKRAKDWELYHAITCESKTQAIKIEQHIKKMRNSNYIDNFKRYPELSEKLKNRFK